MSNESPQDVSESEVSRSWKKFTTPILLLLIVAGVVYLSSISNVWFTSQKITDYSISGTNLSDSSKFFDIAKEISYGKSKDSVLLKLIEKRIEKDAYVSKCIVSFSGVDKIDINIDERRPFVYIQTESGLDYLDQEGKLLPYKVLVDYSDMIVISGFSMNDSSLLNKAILIASKIYNYDDLSHSISEIRYVNNDKGFEFIGLFENNTIYFGLDENVTKKIEKLKLLYTNESSKLVLRNNDVVDLRWYDRIILSKK